MHRMAQLRSFAIAGAALALALAACGDGGDGADEAEALGDSYEEFTTALASTVDISAAADDTKERLTDNCDDLAGAVDDDGLGGLCDELDEAVDDEDQVKFDAVKQQYAGFDDMVRATIQREIAEAGEFEPERDDDGATDDVEPPKPITGDEDGSEDDSGNGDDGTGFDRNEPIPGDYD